MNKYVLSTIMISLASVQAVSNSIFMLPQANHNLQAQLLSPIESERHNALETIRTSILTNSTQALIDINGENPLHWLARHQNNEAYEVLSQIIASELAKMNICQKDVATTAYQN